LIVLSLKEKWKNPTRGISKKRKHTSTTRKNTFKIAKLTSVFVKIDVNKNTMAKW